MNWSLVDVPELSEQEFVVWRGLLEKRIGVHLADHQKQFLQSQVSMRMRELGESNYAHYFKRIADPQSGVLEWSILVDRLVVKETSFFRHKASFDFVGQQLQERVINASANGESLTSYDAWSLGCATGEEPYSLAMILSEVFDLAKIDPQFSILATDVSRVALSVARAGHYSLRKLEFVKSPLRIKYFTEIDRDQFRFEHEVQDKICFSMANALRKDEMPPLRFDLVFCQNVLIYFQQSLRKSILDSVANRLKPGGMLVIGLGEVINWNNPLVERVTRADVQCYQRLRH